MSKGQDLLPIVEVEPDSLSMTPEVLNQALPNSLLVALERRWYDKQSFNVNHYKIKPTFGSSFCIYQDSSARIKNKTCNQQNKTD